MALARTLTLAAAALLPVAAPATAVDPMSTAPADRAALLALPSVYRVETRVEVRALRTRDGRVLPLPARGRVITELGTAFAVAPDGTLATVAHVAAPAGRTLALAAAPLALAAQGTVHSEDYLRRWVDRTGAAPVDARTLSIRVWPAVQAGDPPSAPAAARLLPAAVDRAGDLALLRIPARGAPGLILDDGATSGTPVVTIGFGQDAPLADTAGRPPVPTVRAGTISRTILLEGYGSQRFTVVDTPVENGDSGGPAVDPAGRVHGIVRFRRTERATGARAAILDPAARLRALMRRAGVENAAGPAAEAYADGIARLGRLDAAGAADAFAAARRAYPAHAAAARGEARAQALATAGYALEGRPARRETLVAVALLCGLVSVACGLGLVLPRGGAGGRSAGAIGKTRSRLLD